MTRGGPSAVALRRRIAGERLRRALIEAATDHHAAFAALESGDGAPLVAAAPELAARIVAHWVAAFDPERRPR